MWEKYVSEFGFLKDICLSIFEIIIAKKKRIFVNTKKEIMYNDLAFSLPEISQDSKRELNLLKWTNVLLALSDFYQYMRVNTFVNVLGSIKSGFYFNPNTTNLNIKS